MDALLIAVVATRPPARHAKILDDFKTNDIPTIQQIQNLCLAKGEDLETTPTPTTNRIFKPRATVVTGVPFHQFDAVGDGNAIKCYPVNPQAISC